MEVCDGGRENPSSPDWAWVQGEVGDNPFMALANGFKTALAKHDQRLRDVVAALSEDPGVLPRLAQALIDARLLVASQGEAGQPVVMLWSMPGGFLPGPASLIGYRRRRNGNTPALLRLLLSPCSADRDLLSIFKSGNGYNDSSEPLIYS